MGKLLKIWLFFLAFAGKGSFAWGVELDLRSIPDGSAKTTPLEGDWEYSPSPIIPGQALSSQLGSPQEFWMKTAEFGEFSSFRVFLKREPTQEALLLIVSDLPAYRVLANGRVILEKGRMPRASASAVAERGTRAALLPQAENIELIFETATPLPRWLSWPGKIMVGPESTVRHSMMVESILFSLMLGGLFVIGIYHISLFIFTPSRSVTLILALFCLVNVARSAVSSEFETLYYFFPHFPYELSYKVQLIGYYLGPALFLSFLRLSFPKTVSRRLQSAVWIVTTLFCLFVLGFPASTYAQYNPIFHAVTLIVFLASTSSLYRALKLRIPGSQTMLLACLALGFATLNDLAYSENLPSFGPIIHYGFFVFILMQSLILSSQFSLAFAELAHTYKEFTKIVYLHTVKLIAGGQAIEETMPVGSAEATVIAFDIVGSSKIKHVRFPEAVERMMGRCYDAMSEGYDATHLQCPAYRVKEMGDGLICSVGFPFQTGSTASKGSVALKLAKKFATIFKEEMEKLELPHEAYCSIGIAGGQVEGFFPRFGNKQYDLRGKSIMLATRYEAMRNLVYEKTQHRGSLIFIHDDVYKELLADEQASLQIWDATADDQRIRDDVQASRAWYIFVPHAMLKPNAA